MKISLGRGLRCCTALMVLFLGIVQCANSQALPSVTYINPVTSIITNAPGVGTVGTASGVTATASNAASYALPNGAKVAIPISASAAIGRSAIAAVASSIIRNPATAIGAGLLAYDIYNRIKDSGMHVCPPPDFFCHDNATPNGNGYQVSSGTTTWPIFGTGQEACQNFFNSFNASDRAFYGNSISVISETGSTFVCQSASNGLRANGNKGRTFCASGSLVAGVCKGSDGLPLPDTAYSDSEFRTGLENKMTQDPATAKKYYDAVQADNARFRLNLPAESLVPAASPLTWNAPKVTAPPVVVSTETLPQPDGSTRTKTVSEGVEISPTPQGSTVSQPGIDFPVKRTITTVVSDPANVVAPVTSTQVINDAASKPIEFPTDYNREDTQKLILKSLDGSTVPDGKTAYDSVKTQIDTNTNDTKIQIDSISKAPHDTSWGFSFQLPSATCAPFVYPYNMGTLDPCPAIPKIIEITTYLWSLMTCFACLSMVKKTIDGGG